MNILVRNLVVGNHSRFLRICSSLSISRADFIAGEKCDQFASRPYITITPNTVRTELCHGKNWSIQQTTIRLKSKKTYRKSSERAQDSDDENENEDDDHDFREGNKGDKQIKKIKVGSLRLDSIVAAGLNISKK